MSVNISGTLKDGLQSILPNTELELRAKKTSSKVIVESVAHYFTSLQGTYSFILEVGSYALYINFGSMGPQFVGDINVLVDSIDGTLEDFLTIPGEDEITPEILQQVLQARLDAQEAANRAEQSALKAKEYADLAEAVSDNEFTFVRNPPSDPDGTIAGMAGTSVDQFFRVAQGPTSDIAFKYYKHTVGGALPVADLAGYTALNTLELKNTRLDELSVAKIANLPNSSAIINSSGSLAFQTFEGWYNFRFYLTGKEKVITGIMSGYVSGDGATKIPYYIVVDKGGKVLSYVQPGTSNKEFIKVSDLPAEAHSVYINYRIFGTTDTAASYGSLNIYNYEPSLMSNEQRLVDTISSNGLNTNTTAKVLALKDISTDPNVLVGSLGVYSQSAIYQGWRMVRIDLTGVTRITGVGNSYSRSDTRLYLPALVVYNSSGSVIQYVEARNYPGSVEGNNKVNIDLSLVPGASYALALSAYLFDGGSLVLNYATGDVPLKTEVNKLDSVMVDNGVLPLDSLELTLTGRVDNPQVLTGQNGVYTTGQTYSTWYNTRVDLTNAVRLRGVSTSYNRVGIFVPAIVIYDTSGAVVFYIDNTVPESSGVDKSFDVTVTPNMSHAFVQYQNTRPNLYLEAKYSQNILKGLGERVSDLEEGNSTANLELIVPKIIYTVANDIDYKVLGQTYTGPRVALKRIFNASLYLDNFIQFTNVEHPNLQFDTRTTTRLITPYSPVITAGAIENPNLNGGNPLFEENISYGIWGNTGTVETRSITNRSVLNSASKDKVPTVLIIGDSVSFGQDAYFSNSNSKWNYTMILSRMFRKDKAQNGGSGYGFRTVGTIGYLDADGEKSYNEAYSGTTLQGAGLFNNPKFLDSNGNFSFNNWLTKYRTCNANGDRLYFNASGATTGTAGPNNTGYLADGSDSGLLIGSAISNTLSLDVYEPTHVFCFHCSNGVIPKSDYDLFITRVRASFPNAIIGLGTPHVAGTYFPSKYPHVKSAAIWEYDQTYNNRQVTTAKVLIDNYWNSTNESNKVFVLPTMWVTPAADAFSCTEVNDPYTDVVAGGTKLMPVGQRADVHVGSKAQAAYAYQLYSWLKWTAVKGLF